MGVDESRETDRGPPGSQAPPRALGTAPRPGVAPHPAPPPLSSLTPGHGDLPPQRAGKGDGGGSSAGRGGGGNAATPSLPLHAADTRQPRKRGGEQGGGRRETGGGSGLPLRGLSPGSGSEAPARAKWVGGSARGAVPRAQCGWGKEPQRGRGNLLERVRRELVVKTHKTNIFLFLTPEINPECIFKRPLNGAALLHTPSRFSTPSGEKWLGPCDSGYYTKRAHVTCSALVV